VDNPHTYLGIIFLFCQQNNLKRLHFTRVFSGYENFLLKKQNNTKIGVGDNSVDLKI
jgi:hypothetical protein